MTKTKKLHSLIAAAAIGLILAALLLGRGILVPDCTAEWRGNSLFWKDTRYIPCSGEYNEGGTIAKTRDGCQINEVKEDPTHTFLVVRSFLDESLLVRDDYDIPTSGTITAVFWNGTKIEDDAFCRSISDILEHAAADHPHVIEGLFQLKGNQKMRPLFVGYEGCPIGTFFAGYLGTIDGTWYITTGDTSGPSNPDGSSKPYTVWCYTIPETYVPVLEPYFS